MLFLKKSQGRQTFPFYNSGKIFLFIILSLSLLHYSFFSPTRERHLRGRERERKNKLVQKSTFLSLSLANAPSPLSASLTSPHTVGSHPFGFPLVALLSRTLTLSLPLSIFDCSSPNLRSDEKGMLSVFKVCGRPMVVPTHWLLSHIQPVRAHGMRPYTMIPRAFLFKQISSTEFKTGSQELVLCSNDEIFKKLLKSLEICGRILS